MDSLYKTFLWESAYYGIIASVIGSVLGYVCTIFIEAATSDTLQLVAIPVIPILEATLLAVGACLMATAIPLRKISKMSIVDIQNAIRQLGKFITIHIDCLDTGIRIVCLYA